MYSTNIETIVLIAFVPTMSEPRGVHFSGKMLAIVYIDCDPQSFSGVQGGVARTMQPAETLAQLGGNTAMFHGANTNDNRIIPRCHRYYKSISASLPLRG
jgi:hypothetical protein